MSEEYVFLNASELLRKDSGKEFSRMVAESYIITDWIRKDNPDHFDLFYTKYIPGIFSGEREIISCYLNGQIVATAFLKKNAAESKISTFCSRLNLRGGNIVSGLMDRCFEWLKTTKPLITITEYKLSQFAEIIEEYEWVESEVIEVGQHTYDRQHVYNAAS